jgi:MYXO-CTERM domain-containing protein
MIATRTRTWWQHFSAAGVLFALASCSSEAVAPPQPFDDDEPGALAGELTVYIANYDDGTADTRYFLKVAEGDERRLNFSSEPEVTPGTRIKVWGTQREDRLAVAKYKITQEMPTEGIGSQAQRSEIIDAAVKPGRVLCAALVNIDGGTAKTALTSVKNSFHSGATSVNAYYRENSFGQVGLDGDTYGPFTYTGFSGCNYSGLASSIKPMIKAQNAACQQFAFVFGPGGGCGWSGLGQVGTSDKPASDTWYADSVSCVVAVQEPGHNYGMQHSSSITCSGSPFLDNPSSCTHGEYGDKYDTMGGGCFHMNAWQKLYQKWFGGCNGVRTTSSGKFNLYPIEAPCNGVQVLQVPFPGGKTRSFQSTTLTSYYLELRTAIGFDSKYPGPSVLVHTGAAPILPNQANPRGSKTWVIAAGGAAAASWGLKAGQSFADPAGGLTITVDSVSNANAVIDIAYTAGSGEPVCLDGNNTPFSPPGAADCTSPPPISDAAPPRPPVDVRTDTGTGGTGGAGLDAAGGTAGTAGAAGSGGLAGASGAGGAAGKAGSSGAGGGTAGSGGNTGGSGGSTGGTGGTGGTGATGGTDTGGTGGTGGDSGRAGAGASRPTTPEPLNSGCGCKVAGEGAVPGARTGGLALLGLVGLFGGRRRNRRQRKG